MPGRALSALRDPGPLAPLPRALYEAARRAAQHAGFPDITFNCEDQGEVAEIVDVAGRLGVSFEVRLSGASATLSRVTVKSSAT